MLERLHAYVDQELPSAERAALEAHLAAHPDDAVRVRAWQAQNAALHTLFDPVLAEPHHVRVAQPKGGNWPRVLPLAAALALGVAIGFVARSALLPAAPATPLIARQAAAAYVAYTPEVRHPVEVSAAEEQHLVAWLSKRLAAPLRAPSLAAEGWLLLGGRLLPAAQASDAAPIALLLYENTQGRRLSLLIKRDAASADTAFRFSQEGATRVFHWIDGPLGYALAGEVDRAELQRLADAVHRQLNP